MAWLWIFCLALEIGAGRASASDEFAFRKEKMKIGGQTIVVEVAETDRQHSRGLMFREKLGEKEGMIFVFTDEDYRSFWMKNTIIDLAIGYFDKNRKLVDVQEMKATSAMDLHPPSYPSRKPAMYALEVRPGWFERNKIKLGSTFVLGEEKPAKPARRKSGH